MNASNYIQQRFQLNDVNAWCQEELEYGSEFWSETHVFHFLPETDSWAVFDLEKEKYLERFSPDEPASVVFKLIKKYAQD